LNSGLAWIIRAHKKNIKKIVELGHCMEFFIEKSFLKKLTRQESHGTEDNK